MHWKPFFLGFISIVLLWSCQQNRFQKHEQGFEYIMFESYPDSTKPKIGDVIVLSMDYYLNNDSLLFSSKELGNPFRMKLKRSNPMGATIDDAIATLHLGDSACFKVNANLYYTVTKGGDVPNFIKQNDELYFYIKLKEVTNYKAFVREKAKQQKDTPEKELKMLERYIQMANIEVKPTLSGVYIIEDIAGKGSKPEQGQVITMHYQGYFVNGQVFSSTYETGRPFEVVFGKSDLIAGFEEGLSQMKKGGRYRLIIPSHMAYGKEGKGPIPPNKTLIFEIDILDIQ